MADEVSDLERLIAIEDIKVLKARRDRALDAKEWDLYLSMHAPEHVSSRPSVAVHDRPIAQVVRETAIMLEHMDTTHHSHTPDITIHTPTTASGVWAMEDMLYWNQGDEEHWMHGFGYYEETYEKRDGRWLFTSRVLSRIHVRTSPGGEPHNPAVITPRKRAD